MGLVNGFKDLYEALTVLYQDVFTFQNHFLLLGRVFIIWFFVIELNRCRFFLFYFKIDSFGAFLVFELYFMNVILGYVHFDTILYFRTIYLWLEFLLVSLEITTEIIGIECSIYVSIEWSWIFKILVVDIASKCRVNPHEIALAIIFSYCFTKEFFVLCASHLLEDVLMLQEIWLLFNQDMNLLDYFLIWRLREVILLKIGNSLLPFISNLIKRNNAI